MKWNKLSKLTDISEYKNDGIIWDNIAGYPIPYIVVKAQDIVDTIDERLITISKLRIEIENLKIELEEKRRRMDASKVIVDGTPLDVIMRHYWALPELIREVARLGGDFHNWDTARKRDNYAESRDVEITIK